jgi:hypothetical protein
MEKQYKKVQKHRIHKIENEHKKNIEKNKSSDWKITNRNK